MSHQTATFGAGCFWGVEARFREMPGILDAAVGYMGGQIENPTYQDVCTGKSGHIEVVELEYDESVVSYQQLLELFFNSHNPTTLNRQGLDVDHQYRSVIFARGAAQEEAAQLSIQTLNDSGRWDQPLVTDVVPASQFWRAEEHHQQYLAKNGGGFCQV